MCSLKALTRRLLGEENRRVLYVLAFMFDCVIIHVNACMLVCVCRCVRPCVRASVTVGACVNMTTYYSLSNNVSWNIFMSVMCDRMI